MRSRIGADTAQGLSGPRALVTVAPARGPGRMGHAWPISNAQRVAYFPSPSSRRSSLPRIGGPAGGSRRAGPSPDAVTGIAAGGAPSDLGLQGAGGSAAGPWDGLR